jgi:Mg2+ and Co2+ transporter CorA
MVVHMTDDTQEDIGRQGTKNQQATTPFDAAAYQTIVDTIKKTITVIDQTKKQIKEMRESLESILQNDSTYQEHLKASKEAAKIKNKTKQEVLKRPEAVTLVAKIKDLMATLKDNQQTLSENLVSYINIAGVNEIEDENGVPQQITFTARLKPVGSRE